MDTSGTIGSSDSSINESSLSDNSSNISFEDCSESDSTLHTSDEEGADPPPSIGHQIDGDISESECSGSSSDKDSITSGDEIWDTEITSSEEESEDDACDDVEARSVLRGISFFLTFFI